ncbi:MAG: chemotaxis response regulator protein-glutamate methylesterase [Verrucomicrobia bacterium]|nr:MAG: chemotaxis response regulator protein-glutamate methylesterase [Verrucomicrobiota bacterium]
MNKARVLIVDDSIVIRRLLSETLSSDPAIEIVGTAANGKIALSRIPQLNPDLVTLDVEMPELDGLATLREIRKTHPKLPVIMFSTLTERGAAATIDALSHGANDYVTKPANVGSVGAGLQQVRTALLPKIKALTGIVPQPERRPPPATTRPPNGTPVQAAGAPPPPRARATAPAQRVDILAIGTSTGGPNALAALLPEIPPNFPVPIVIVQHMPPMFTRLLASNLSPKCNLPVLEGTEGAKLEAGHIYIAPGDYHMTLARSGNEVRLHLNQDAPENSCRPAVDVLFRSVAALYGPHTLGVVLTGMGHDGLRGSEHIKAAGGQVIVQDEASSVVWGMAGSVAHAGLADEILPLNQIGRSILRRVSQWRAGQMARTIPTIQH